jgi:hypothetical protein
MRKILVYGRQVFASMAFCEMLSKEFSDRIIVNANSSEALDDLEPNLIDLVVVTTSAASNQSAMTARHRPATCSGNYRGRWFCNKA